MDFGFTLKPEHDLQRTTDLARRRASGTASPTAGSSTATFCGASRYVLLTLMAQATERMRLGTCVTNPATREPSVTASTLAVLDEVSDGRMDLGIGRGDSARRVLGKPPDHDPHAWRRRSGSSATSSRERRSTYEGTEIQLPWAGKWTLPVWVAGYGPMALAMTGRVRERRDPAARGPRPDPLVRLPGPRGGGRRRPRAGQRPGPVGRAGARRPPGGRAGADPLVPGPGGQPRRGPGQPLPARAAARGADRLRPRAGRVRLSPPRGGRLVQRGLRG